jgi:hypothetical protein
MTIEETRLNEARALLAEIDERSQAGAALCVGKNEDPIQALRKIHAFLVRNARDHVNALAAANLERVLDRLVGFEMRVSFTK